MVSAKIFLPKSLHVFLNILMGKDNFLSSRIVVTPKGDFAIDRALARVLLHNLQEVLLNDFCAHIRYVRKELLAVFSF